MALKETIETWHLACCLLDDLQFQEAATKLRTIENPSAKIIHNLGCLFMLQKLFADATQTFKLSIEKDNHLALSYFTRGLSYHHLGRFAEAEADFKSVKALIKGDDINYKQLGAPVALSTKTVELCLSVIKDSATNKQHKGLPVISIMDCIFRPPKKMVDNLIKQDFLGKSKIFVGKFAATIQSHTKVISSCEDKDNKIGSGQQLSVQSTMIQQSLSLPSSPVTSRHHNSPVLGNRNLPAPPTRPPPRLRRELTSNQSNETISKNSRETKPSYKHEDVVQSNTHGKNTIYSLAKVFSSQDQPNVSPISAAGGRLILPPAQQQHNQQPKSPNVGPYSVTVLHQQPFGSAKLQGGPLSPPPPVPDSVTSQHKRHLSDVTPYKVTNLHVSPKVPINVHPTRQVVNTSQQKFSLIAKPIGTACTPPVRKPLRPPPPKLENKD